MHRRTSLVPLLRWLRAIPATHVYLFVWSVVVVMYEREKFLSERSAASAALLRREDLAAELRDYARANDEAGVRDLLSESMWPDPSDRIAFVNTADEHTGNTALHMASANGHTEVVRLLLEAGADPAAQNEAGNTPLHWASMNQQVQCVEVLLGALRQRGASAFVLNKSGRSAYDEAVLVGCRQVTAMLMRFAEEHPSQASADAYFNETTAETQ
jgi:ankyrin repeat protein